MCILLVYIVGLYSYIYIYIECTVIYSDVLFVESINRHLFNGVPVQYSTHTHARTHTHTHIYMYWIYNLL